MASQAYNTYVAQVRADGGRVTVAPPGWPAEAYDGESLERRRATGREPGAYSANGRVGYYRVPPAIEAEVLAFSGATAVEVARGAEQLLDQWNIPTSLHGVGDLAEGVTRTLQVAVLLGSVVLAFLIARRVQ